MDLSELRNMPPDQLAELKAFLGVPDQNTQGRSPQRKPLTDLRLMPTKDDPRPNFYFVEAPRDGRDLTRTTPFPKLYWNLATGDEITVRSEQAAAELGPGYTDRAPADVVIDPMAALEAQLQALPEADRKIIFEAAKSDRLRAIQAQLANVADADLDRLMAQAVSAKKKTA